jgi:signal transduction histidine kinase
VPSLQPLFDSLANAFAPRQRNARKLLIVPTGAFVSTDAFLRRILQNLLSNALRYDRTVVRAWCWAAGGLACEGVGQGQRSRHRTRQTRR